MREVLHIYQAITRSLSLSLSLSFSLSLPQSFSPSSLPPSLPLLSHRLIVRFDDDMVARFNDEDDFIIEIEFDNQKGHFDLFVRY